jgi:uncharacterized protein (DUF427 family)
VVARIGAGQDGTGRQPGTSAPSLALSQASMPDREATMTAAHDIRVEHSRKRVRILLAGELVADTTSPLLVWEVPYYPTYYVPADDVRAKLVPAGADTHELLGEAEVLTVAVPGGPTAERAARRYPASPARQLQDAVRFEWDAMSEWLEEDEPVYTHARDPHTRVDILASSRHVRVEIDGVTVADSRSPRILFETGLPPRYYVPLPDIRTDLLRPSDSETHCPYKGAASYWSVDTGTSVHEDIVWIYRTPLPESQKIAGLAAFYDEKVDVFVDDVPQRRPQTKFS